MWGMGSLPKGTSFGDFMGKYLVVTTQGYGVFLSSWVDLCHHVLGSALHKQL